MRRLLAFIHKEFIHIFRDPRTMVILFGMPVAQLLIFGFVVSNEIRNASIAVLDHSRDEHTRKLVEEIVSTGYFKVTASLSHESEADEVFRAGKANLVIIFDHNFTKKLESEGEASVQVIADASDPNSAEILTSYIRGIVSGYIQKLQPQSDHKPLVTVTPRMIFNPGLKGVFMFVPGTMALILMLISAMMTSITITREKETGTMEVLLVSPLHPIQIIIGKVTPYFLLSVINTIVILLTGYFVFGLPVRGNVLLLMASCMLFILMALSLGILISTVARTQQVAMFISMFALLLPTMLLSGFIFPIENMPDILQYISLIMPPRWFISIIKNIMIKGAGLAFIWQELLILTGMTLFFLGLSARKFKLRLE